MHILTSFSASRQEWGVSELARHLGYPKSLVSKMLTTLSSWGMVEQLPVTRAYRLGYRLLTLAGLVPDSNNLRAVALPVLQQLAERTRETAKVSVISDGESLVLERVETSYHMRMTIPIGQRNPLWAGASNLILLCHRSRTEIDRILQAKAPADHLWRQDPQAFYARLDEIRSQGYAFSVDEVEVGLIAISAPIRGQSGEVVASASIVGPTNRLLPAEYPNLIQEVRNAAATISSKLGAT
jgi:DNA-binding IclR family transcriptional regulator